MAETPPSLGAARFTRARSAVQTADAPLLAKGTDGNIVIGRFESFGRRAENEKLMEGMMKSGWDPRAKPPRGAEPSESLRWLAEQLEAFQRVRPDLPQGRIASLSKRNRDLLVRAWDKAREEAQLADAKEHGPEWYETVRKFQKARTITVASPKRKRLKGRAK
jgi:hypothetical protein